MLKQGKLKKMTNANIENLIIERIQSHIPNTEVELYDLTGTLDHWEAVIISSSFEGKRSFERQKWVYQALGELMHGPIHAFTMKTLTPEQFQAQNQEQVPVQPQTPQNLVQLK